MDKDAIVSALLCIILSLCLSTKATPTHLQTCCSKEASSNSRQFHHNLNTLLESLPFNTSRASGYFNTTIGDGEGKVYGQALCRGDVDPIICQECLKTAAQELKKKCKTYEDSIKNKCELYDDSITWYDLCQVHYSSRMFISINEYAGQLLPQNSQKKSVPNPDKFTPKWIYLMQNLTYKAAFKDFKLMFAAGEISVSNKVTIYGLVQCTRDIPQSQCRNCLESAWGDLKGCCSHREGGTLVSASCNARFELFRFYNGTSQRLTYQGSHEGKGVKWIVEIVFPSLALVVLLVVSCVAYLRWKKRSTRDEIRSQSALMRPWASSSASITLSNRDDLEIYGELPVMDLATICAATDGFSDLNKLGQGGFGTVYKGMLADGKEVAVKRLSMKSWQGLEEFKNELVLIAKVQHRNLVRLLGCCIEGEEKLLIYEFMPNKSLDNFIFHSENRSKLEWKTCYNIISGIARGLLYLHEDSRLRIIHRDLKPSNVLLDHEMVAKISDFGMARMFCDDQNTANTKRVVGTYGYMAPEYAMEGQFSTKSDVFSFGVILLEIISGKRNGGSYLKEHSLKLIRYAWKLWKEGKEMEFVGPWMKDSCQIGEVVRCMQIGLLCVQQDPKDRPNMSGVVVLLGSESISLPQPNSPHLQQPQVVQMDNTHSVEANLSNFTISSSIST